MAYLARLCDPALDFLATQQLFGKQFFLHYIIELSFDDSTE
jgi:hypothetical protein